MLYVVALLIGIVAGLRVMTPLAAVSWGARLGALDLSGSWLAFLGYAWTPWILTLLALAELVNDKLPATPSRKAPPAFAARIVSGGVCGFAVAAAGGNAAIGLVLGAAGAVIGTLGGAAARGRLAAAFGRDLPAALTEDAVTIAGAALLVFAA